jgi:hypothetical protein
MDTVAGITLGGGSEFVGDGSAFVGNGGTVIPVAELDTVVGFVASGVPEGLAVDG